MISTPPNLGATSNLKLSSPKPPNDFRYFAYGLNISSELPMPEFNSTAALDASVNVAVRFGGADDWVAGVRERSSSWHVGMSEARFWFQGVGAFRVSNGTEIVITPEPGIDNALLRMYVEGMMMATVLHQRGYFVLHASVICIGSTSVAVLGPVGAGKSSTAAALHARGNAVVTDDNAAISLSDSAPLVTPAFPYVKIFPGIAAALGYSKESLKIMHPTQPKYVGSVATDFPQSPVPLRNICILSRVAKQPIAPLSRAETMMELVRNSVPTRWKLPGDANHFRQCATLAGQVPAFSVRTFERLPELPVLAEIIERHHRGITE